MILLVCKRFNLHKVNITFNFHRRSLYHDALKLSDYDIWGLATIKDIDSVNIKLRYKLNWDLAILHLRSIKYDKVVYN